MIYEPIVLIVPRSTVESLQPLVDQIAAGIDTDSLRMRLNGWTPEMLAWGRCLTAAAEAGLEVLEITPRRVTEGEEGLMAETSVASTCVHPFGCYTSDSCEEVGVCVAAPRNASPGRVTEATAPSRAPSEETT